MRKTAQSPDPWSVAFEGGGCFLLSTSVYTCLHLSTLCLCCVYVVYIVFGLRLVGFGMRLVCQLLSF